MDSPDRRDRRADATSSARSSPPTCASGRHTTRRHALPARAQRLPAHRPRQVDLPELRHRRASSAAAATCASTTPTRPRRSRSTSTPSRPTCAGWASTGASTCTTPPTTSSSSTTGRSTLIRRRQGLRRRPLGRRDPRAPRHAHRARPQQPVARPAGRREPRPVRAHARGRVPGRRARAAREDRHGLAATSTCATRCCTGSSTPTHPRTGDAWCIYPTYDFAHGQSDAIEGITHSLCTLEFEDHRPLYDWLIEHLPVPSRPRQIEFARLNLTYTVLSKRFLLRLVNEGRVRGWDDPRMPTISGLRRRGFPAEGIRDFAAMIGVAKARQRRRDRPARVRRARRAQPDGASAGSACCDPLKVVIDELPGGPGRGGRRRPTTPRTRRRARARCPSRASCGSSATTSWRTRRRSSSASRRAARCACARAYFVTCTRGRQGRGGRGRRAALHLRPGHARRRRARRPPAQGHAPLGLGRARRAGRGAPLRPPVQRGPTRAPTATCWPTSNPASETVLTGALVEPAWPTLPVGADRPVRAAGLLRAGPGLAPGRPGLQPDADAQGHLGQGSRRARLGPLYGHPLASGSAVKRLTLDQGIEGSNPSSPARYPRVAVLRRRYSLTVKAVRIPIA